MDMPAETWINFEKDILYLSVDFCDSAMENPFAPETFSFFSNDPKFRLTLMISQVHGFAINNNQTSTSLAPQSVTTPKTSSTID